MDHRNLIIRLDPSDNVGVAACSLRDGQMAHCEGRPLTVRGDVPTGHKIAIRAIAAGAKVVKFAAPIGSATCDIQPGEHVHLQNLKSDYLPTYTFDAGKAYVRRV
jgi:altronate dehydratase small subunit